MRGSTGKPKLNAAEVGLSAERHDRRGIGRAVVAQFMSAGDGGRWTTDRMIEEALLGNGSVSHNDPKFDPPSQVSEQDARSHPGETEKQQLIDEMKLQNHALLEIRNRLEHSLKEYTELYDFAPVGYFTFDADGKIRKANLTGAALLGQERADLINQRFGGFVSTTSRPIFNAFLNQALAGASREHCEIVLAPENRPPRDLYLEGIGLGEDDHRWCHIAALDITNRKLTEKALRASEAFNTIILNSLSESVVVLDAEGIILKVNTAWERFANQNGAPELARRSVGLSYRNVCLSAVEQPEGETALAAWTGIEAVLKGAKNHFVLEYPCNAPGISRWFRMYVSPLANQHQGVVILHENITERRQNEELLKLSEARYSAIVEGQTDLVCRFLPDGTLNYCNHAYCHYFGRSRENILATNFMDLVPEKDRAFVKAQAGLCNANYPTHTWPIGSEATI